MKIITWNVNGIRACMNKGLLEFVEKESADIFCVQETKARPEQVEVTAEDLDGAEFFWSSAEKKGYSGTLTVLKEPVGEALHGVGIPKFDNEGRFIITRHPNFLLYNIYFPNGGASEERHYYKMEFLEMLLQHLDKKIKEGNEIILVGDYNIAHTEIDIHDPVRLDGESGFKPEERDWMNRFFDLGFTDCYRHFHPEEKDIYSWWSYRSRARQNNRGWRIDYISVTNGLKDKLKSAEVMMDVEGSDHCPVKIELEL